MQKKIFLPTYRPYFLTVTGNKQFLFLGLILYWLSRELLWDDFTWPDIVLITSYPVLTQSRTALGWFYLVWYCLDYLLSCTVANCSGMILLGLILSWLPLILYWLSRELLWDDFTWSDIVLITSYPVLTQSQTALGWFYLVWYCLDYLLSCTVANCSGMILLGLILSWLTVILFTDSVAHCSGMILLGLILSWFRLILYCLSRGLLWDDFTWSDIVLIDCYPVYWLSRKLLWDDFTWSDIVLIPSYPVLSQSQTALGWFYLVWYCLDWLLSCLLTQSQTALGWFYLVWYCLDWLLSCLLTQSRTALGWFYLVWYCLDSLVSCSVTNCSGMILLGLILSWFPRILYCRKLLWDDFTWSDIVLIDCYPVLSQSQTALGWFYLVWYCLDWLLSCTVADCSEVILLGLILSWFPRILYCRELLWDDFTWSDIVLIDCHPVLSRTALGWFYLVWYCLDSLLSCTVANCSGMILLGLILSWLTVILYCRELLWDDFTWSDIVLITSYPVLTQSRTALGWFYLVWYCLVSLLSLVHNVKNLSWDLAKNTKNTKKIVSSPILKINHGEFWFLKLCLG